jgi:hypothetical protein
MATKPPRQRDGKVYAGGKKLRRAWAKLTSRQKQHGITQSGGASRARQMQSTNPPGSMKA